MLREAWEWRMSWTLPPETETRAHPSRSASVWNPRLGDSGTIRGQRSRTERAGMRHEDGQQGC